MSTLYLSPTPSHKDFFVFILLHKFVFLRISPVCGSCQCYGRERTFTNQQPCTVKTGAVFLQQN